MANELGQQSVLGSFLGGRQAKLGIQAQEAELARAQRLQELLGQVQGGQSQPVGAQPPLQQPQLPVLGAQPPTEDLGAKPTQAGQPQSQTQALAELAIQFPERFEQVNTNLGLITQQQKDEAADFSFRLRNTPFEQRSALIRQRAATPGRNMTDTASLEGMTEEEQNQALDTVQIAALSPEKRVELRQGPEPTALQQNLIAAGFQPGTEEFQQQVLRSLTKPTTQVQVGIKQEGEERKGLAGVQAKRFGKVIDEGEAAAQTLANLDQLDAIDVDTGALSPAKASLASVVKDLGFESLAGQITDVGNAQAFDAVSGRIVQSVLNQATGPQTDDDARRAAKTISTLGDDPKARQFKSDSLRALALRQQQRADFIGERIDAGGTFSTANKEWNEFKSRTPNISGVVKNPATGLPIFFFQFEQIARGNKPNVTDQEIMSAWRDAHGK